MSRSALKVFRRGSPSIFSWAMIPFWLTSLTLAVVVVQLSIAQTAVDEFEKGNSFYRNGQFDQAATAYEQILNQGLATPELYFNLGNAYYRLGKIAPAILSYERALRLAPNDPDTKHNLDLANLKTTDRIEPLPELFFIQWLHSISAVFPIHTTALLFVACWILLFGSLAAFYLFSGESIPGLRWFALFVAVLLIPIVILLTSQYLDWRSRNNAIVTASVVTAKTSPDSQSVDAFVIHEGLKVALSDAVGDWVRITLADGKVGWIRANECERI
ncbi:MAG: tetratricopeptide repeat protein [Bacteroidota bacterium]